MTSSRGRELFERADEERRRCRDWLSKFHAGQTAKVFDESRAREAAMRDLKVSKKSFDSGWIEAIGQSGRHDWYKPLRRRTANDS